MRHHPALPKSNIIYTIAVIGFIYSIHLSLPIYSNSSFLSLFTSERNVGLIYMLGSALTVLGYIFIPELIRKAGNYRAALWLIVAQGLLIYGMISTSDVRFIAFYFALQTAVVALIGFCLDIFLELYSKVANVGTIRGMYLTTMNTAWILGPLMGSMLIDGGDNYWAVYVAAIFVLFPLFYLIFKNFPKFQDPHYRHPTIHQTFVRLFKNRNHARLFFVNIVLQTFYAWMTVYSAIYLHTTIGLDWSSIGVIITIMLLPFVLTQLPLGKLADKKYGEKEIMIIGFALLGLSTIALAAITAKSILVWATALFITRMGAAAIEIMVETYFFKTADVHDPSILGFFRVTRSLAYFIAPLLAGTVALFTADFSYQFVVLGILCLLAIIPAWGIHDTN